MTDVTELGKWLERIHPGWRTTADRIFFEFSEATKYLGEKYVNLANNHEYELKIRFAYLYFSNPNMDIGTRGDRAISIFFTVLKRELEN